VQGGDPLARHGSPFESTSWYVIGMACLRFEGACQGVPDIKVASAALSAGIAEIKEAQHSAAISHCWAGTAPATSARSGLRAA